MPTDELRKGFDHDPNKFEEFKKHNKKKSLRQAGSAGGKINRKESDAALWAKDQEHSQAAVLKAVMEN